MSRWFLISVIVLGPTSGAATGPDLTCGDIPTIRHWATDEVETAYSLGRIACNLGDVEVSWNGGPSTDHPIHAQNMYRLSADGGFEQLGYAWLYHSFCAMQQDFCDTCGGPGGCHLALSPACSTQKTASRGGAQGGLAPKWQVNPHTVDFPWPWHPGEGTSGSYRRRIRVKNVEIDPAMNPGARYFVEFQSLSKDDTAAGNERNNASFREVVVSPGSFDLAFAMPTEATRPAIDAWRDAVPDTILVEVQVDADGERDPDSGLYDDGLLIVGSHARQNDDGTWRYEYAVQNLTSHRAARMFRIRVPDEVTVTDIGFHDVDYHSGDGIDGENFDGTDWPGVHENGEMRWETDTFEANENANALRWGTLYNFRFTADAPPGVATAHLGIYRPGVPETMPVAVSAPTLCAADLDGSGAVDFADILAVLAAWGKPGGPEDLDGSGTVDFADVLVILSAWGEC